MVSAQNFKAFRAFSSDQVTVLFAREQCGGLYSRVTASQLDLFRSVILFMDLQPELIH